MKIAIVGGGFTGLSAAYNLAKAGHQVTVFEKEKQLGGLAAGFKKKSWQWPLEKTYHHFFTNDHNLINLARELGLKDKLIIKRPITANFLSTDKKLCAEPTKFCPNQIIQLDSPLHLLRFPYLSLTDKLRTGFLLAMLKINPLWRPLENITAEQLFTAIGGKGAWQMLWEPLMIGKFENYAGQVAASWLWARIKKRTAKLGYIEGGFKTLIDKLAKAITDHDGRIFTQSPISAIQFESGIRNQESWKKQNKTHYSQFIIHNSKFDKVLLSVPTSIAVKFFPHSAFSIQHSALSIPHLHAQTLILETKEPILKNTYWLNITDRSFPFLAAVAHTNFIDKKYYNNHHLTYFGNYLPSDHPYLKMNEKQLLKVFLPFIKRLNPSFHSSSPSTSLRANIIHHSSFIGFYAQPVHLLHYSHLALKLETPVPNLYLANLDSIYPWDRGVNYAIELGIKAADKIVNF